mgnify:CR=1 FL=1
MCISNTKKSTEAGNLIMFELNQLSQNHIFVHRCNNALYVYLHGVQAFHSLRILLLGYIVFEGKLIR